MEESLALGDLNRQIAANSSEDAELDGLFNSLGGESAQNPQAKEIRQGKVDRVQAVLDAKPMISPKKEGEETNYAEQAVAGVADSVQSTFNLLAEVADFADNKLGLNKIEDDDRFTFADEWIPESDVRGHQVVRGVTQFLAPFAAVSKIPKIAAMGTLAKGAVAGAITDFMAFDGADANLADFIQSYPELQNPITEYLADKKNSTDIEGRMKNAIAGVVPGVMVDAVFAGVRALKGRNGLKAIEAAAEGGAKEFKGSLPETTITASPVDGAPPTIGDIAGGKPPEVSPEGIIKPNEGVTTGSPETPNLTRIEADQDVLNAYKNLSEADKEAIDTAVGGTQTLQAVKEAAKKSKITLQDILNKPAGEALNEIEQLKLREGAVEAVAQVDVLAKKAVNSNDPKDLANFLDGMGRATQLARAVKFAAAKKAREFGALKIKVSPLEGEYSEQIIKTYGEQKGWRLAETMAKLDPKSAAKVIAQKSLYRRVFDAAQETYVSNLLTGVKTQVVNFVSSPAMFATTVTERARAPFLKGYKKAVNAESLKGAFAKRTELLAKKMDPKISFDELTKVDAELSQINSQLGSAVQAGTEIGESTQLILGFFDGVKDSIRAMSQGPKGIKELQRMGQEIGKNAKGELRSFDPAISSENLPGGKFIDLLGSVQRFSLNALDTVDSFWKVAFNRAELHATALRLGKKQGLSGGDLSDFIRKTVENPPDFVSAEGKAFAQLNTFTTPLEGLGKKVESVLNHEFGLNEAMKAPHLKVLEPFFRSPVNIAVEGLTRTPFGIAKLMGGKYNTIMREGGTKAQALRAKVELGNTIGAIVGLQAMNGLITGGGPQDYKKRKMLEATGWQRYSVKLGDSFVPLNILGPLGSAIGFYADLAEISGSTPMNAKRAEIGEAAALMAFNLLERGAPEGFVMNMSMFFDAVDKQDVGHFSKIAANMVPLAGYANQVANITDPIQRVTKDANDALFAEVISTLKDKSPWHSATLPAQKNIFGEDILIPQPLAEDGISAFFGVTKKKNDPMLEEIVRLGYFGPLKDPDAPVGEEYLQINMPGKTITLADVTVEMTPQQYSKYVDLAAGKGLRGAEPLRDRLESVVASSKYKNASDERKRLELAKTISVYRDAARDQMLEEFPEMQDMIRLKANQRGGAIKGIPQ